MATLLDNANTDGFGPDVSVTSSFATIRVTGIRENAPARVQLHWSDNGTDFEPVADVMKWDRVYDVDIGAGSGTVKAELLGVSHRSDEAISATITFG